MDKVRKVEEAISGIKDGMVIMVGGFLGVGTPATLIDSLVAKGIRDLTLIANDTAMPDVGVGKLIVGRHLRKAIVSHIGMNPETGRQGYSILQLLFHTPVVLIMLWLLAKTLPYIPPIMQ